MNLHSEIMNIPVILGRDFSSPSGQACLLAYKEGHRDARHVAAELSLKAEARIEELEEVLRQVQRQCAESLSDNMHIKIDELLENK